MMTDDTSEIQVELKTMIRRSRFSFGEGFCSGAILVTGLFALERDWKTGHSWLFGAFLLVFWSVGFFISWQSRKEDRARLQKIAAEFDLICEKAAAL